MAAGTVHRAFHSVEDVCGAARYARLGAGSCKTSPVTGRKQRTNNSRRCRSPPARHVFGINRRCCGKLICPALYSAYQSLPADSLQGASSSLQSTMPMLFTRSPARGVPSLDPTVKSSTLTDSIQSTSASRQKHSAIPPGRIDCGWHRWITISLQQATPVPVAGLIDVSCGAGECWC